MIVSSDLFGRLIRAGEIRPGDHKPVRPKALPRISDETARALLRQAGLVG